MIAPRLLSFSAALALLSAPLDRAQNRPGSDSTSHKVQFINVDTNVKLEVLDWGGSGRPMVLLSGLGDTAHVYDKFAPKLTGANHVYGITRRGFGASSAPAPSANNYQADRLGDDVLAVLDALGLQRPVLVGHSLGGEELSSVGSRHPERVAGLIYLDAGYVYAFYDRKAAAGGEWSVDLPELQRKLQQLQFEQGPADARPLLRELLETTLPQIESDLRELQKGVEETPDLFAPTSTPPSAAFHAILAGFQKYTSIPVQVLAIFAIPHEPPMGSEDGAQVSAFEKGVPSARVVRLPQANHYIYRSNEADVLREMSAFIGGLPQ